MNPQAGSKDIVSRSASPLRWRKICPVIAGGVLMLWAAFAWAGNLAGAENADRPPLEQPGLELPAWVVVGVPSGTRGPELVLSGFYGGRGALPLRWAWVDGSGEVAGKAFVLRGGRNLDLPLPAPPARADGRSCTLLISGVDLDPERVDFRLWSASPDGRMVQWTGRWLLCDPSWVAPGE